MALPVVYADFNALEILDDSSGNAEMPLTGYGTLASLARQHVRLTVGMSVILYEPNDIECEVVIHFDKTRFDPAGRQGEWIARFQCQNICDSTRPEAASKAHPCLVCGFDFAAQTFPGGRNFNENCINCGTSVMEPMAPPHEAT